MLLLAALLFVGAAFAAALQRPQAAPPTPHWPAADDVYDVPGWRVSRAQIDTANGNTYVTREYERETGGLPVILALTTSPSVKTVYRAGADVPFLGSGYENVPLAPELSSLSRGRSVSQLRRGDQGWLQMFSYGERRGLVGNGPVGWSFGIVDTTLGTPNDYYLLRAVVPTSEGPAEALARVSAVADAVFPRVAEWYAHL